MACIQSICCSSCHEVPVSPTMVVLGCMINEGDVILPHIFEQGLRIISDGCVEMLNTVVNDVCNLDLLHFSFFYLLQLYGKTMFVCLIFFVSLSSVLNTQLFFSQTGYHQYLCTLIFSVRKHFSLIHNKCRLQYKWQLLIFITILKSYLNKYFMSSICLYPNILIAIYEQYFGQYFF